MSERYRAVARERGMDLRHFENRVPPGVRRSVGKIAAVFIVASMVSHALRDQVRTLVSEDATRIVYLRTASVSAVRAAVESVAA
jgi:hypothetical protein